MARYSPDIEVLGAVVLSVLGTTRLSDLEPYFDRYGIYHYDPEQYYPIAPLIEMVDDIVRERRGLDSTFDLISLGIANGRTIPLPLDIDSLEKWLNAWAARHPMLYRGTDIGYIHCDKLGGANFAVHIRWPWSDAVAFGTIYGMCQRFLPPETDFTVYYGDNGPRADFGEDETVIHIEWH